MSDLSPLYSAILFGFGFGFFFGLIAYFRDHLRSFLGRESDIQNSK